MGKQTMHATAFAAISASARLATAAVILMAVVDCGCDRLPFAPAKTPDLRSVPWTKVSVYYVANWEWVIGTGAKMGDLDDKNLASWTTTDHDVLALMQTSLVVTNSCDLGLFLVAKDNRIDVTLADGRQYELHIQSSTRLLLNDWRILHTGFMLHVTPAFYDTLKARLEADTKRAVIFTQGLP